MIAITAIIRVRRGYEDRMRESLLAVGASVARDEPDTVNYYIGQSPDQPQLFTTYERFRDRAAMERHNASPAVAAVLALAKEAIAEPVVLHVCEEISAK